MTTTTTTVKETLATIVPSLGTTDIALALNRSNGWVRQTAKKLNLGKVVRGRTQFTRQDLIDLHKFVKSRKRGNPNWQAGVPRPRQQETA